MEKLEPRSESAEEAYDQDEERTRERLAARAWALVSMCAGGLLVLLAMHGTQSEAIYLMDRVVRMDTAGPWGGQLDWARRIVTTKSLVTMLLFVALLVIFISCLGVTATQGRHKCMASSYALSSTSCAGVICMMAMQILQRIQVVQPLIEHQVQHLCNATTYIQLGSALDCSWAGKYGEIIPCSTGCRWKLDILGQQGCWLLPHLCESFPL